MKQIWQRRSKKAKSPAPHSTFMSMNRRPPITRLVPWFIIGFLGLAAARAVGLVPPPLVAVAGEGAGMLTLLSMAALGMGVDVRVLARVGARVTTAVISALSVLVGISLLLVHLLRL